MSQANGPESSQITPDSGELFAATEVGPRGYGQTPSIEYSYYTDPPAQQSGHESPVEIEAPAVDVRDRARYLLSSLDHLAQVNMREGFRKAIRGKDREKVEQSTQYSLPEMAKGVAFVRGQEMLRAKQDFLRAYNLGEEVPAKETDNTFLHEFTNFSQKYGVGANPVETARKSANRDTLRKNLRKVSKIEGDVDRQTYIEQQPSILVTAQDDTPPVLNTRERLIVARDDSDANTLPSTNREKSEFIAIVDELKKPHGIHNHLRETYFRRLREEKAKEGVGYYQAKQLAHEAVISRIFQWGDYLGNAMKDKQALIQLEAKIDDCPSPYALLSEEVEQGTDGVGALVRFMDNRHFRETGERPDFDTLLTIEDRGPQTLPGKNKTVHDAYTWQRPGRADAAVQRVKDQFDSLTIGEIRQAARDAIDDRENAKIVWERVLREVKGTDKHTVELIFEELGLKPVLV